MVSFDEYLHTDDPGERTRLGKLKTISEAVGAMQSTLDWMEAKGITVIPVADRTTLTRMLEQIAGARLLGFDIETEKAQDHPRAGLLPAVSKVRIISIYDAASGKAWVVDARAISGLGWLEAIRAELAIHNAAFDLAHLQHAGIRPDRWVCTMQLDRVLTGENRSLTKLAKERLGLTLSKALQDSNWSRDHLHPNQLTYAAVDAVVAGMIAPLLRADVDDSNLSDAHQLFHRLVRPVISQCPVALDWERHGAWVDGLLKRATSHEFGLKAAGLENIKSSKQKQKFITDRLPTELLIDWPLTDAGALSTQREHLLQAKHIPGLEDLAGFTETTHLLSHFGDKLGEMAVAGAIRPDFQIAGAATGRFTSSNPNFQNLPRGDFKSFIIPGDGHTFLCADYSQIELRVAAEISQEPVMMGAFREGRDLHRYIGQLGLELIHRDDVNVRALGKVLNFGLLFGGGAKMLADFARSAYGVNVTVEEAARLRTLFFQTYPDLNKWQQEAVEWSRAYGCTITKRFGIRNTVDADVYTQAMNYPVQGSAFEVLALALIKINDRLPAGTNISHHVHDEIILRVPDHAIDEASAMMGEAMTEAFKEVFPDAPVGGLVEVHHGKTWAAAKG